MRNFTFIIISSLLLMGCDNKSPTASTTLSGSDRMLMGEGRTESNGLSVTSGNVVIKKGKPGIAFAFSSLPGQAKNFTYFIVFNPDASYASLGTQSKGDNLSASASHTIKAFGNECKAKYRVQLVPDTKAIASDSTSIAGSDYDPANGKLFLVDMKNTPPTVTQLNLELPVEIPDLKNPEASEEFGESTLEHLREQDASVDKFCQAIEQSSN